MGDSSGFEVSLFCAAPARYLLRRHPTTAFTNRRESLSRPSQARRLRVALGREATHPFTTAARRSMRIHTVPAGRAREEGPGVKSG